MLIGRLAFPGVVARAEMSAPKTSAMENEPRNLTIGTLIRVAHALESGWRPASDYFGTPPHPPCFL
jgi:hypothetical protein